MATKNKYYAVMIPLQRKHEVHHFVSSEFLYT